MDADPMAPLQLTAGTVIDGFRLEAPLPLATTAAFWRVARTGGDGDGGADSALPLLMKVPRLEHGGTINIVGFEVEQMILPKLAGPHVPRFVASGGLQNPYIVMELIRGESLRTWLPKLPLPADDVAAIGAKVAVALHDVHRQGVIHLDLKPSNVMLRDNGEAALIDFGFSRHVELPDLLAEEIPGPIGTGAYIAPEQLLGNRDDPRSDIFALGAILYFFATGERPFGEPSGVREWRRRLYQDPAPPRALRPDCPAWLQEIILRCLEIDPGQRHASAAQLAFDLQHPQQIVVTERGERTAHSGPMRAIARWIGGRRLAPAQQGTRRQLDTSPIIMAAIDLAPGTEQLAQALAVAVARLLQMHPDARLTCVNVLRQSRVALDPTEDEHGRNLHLRRLAELQYWARGLPIPAHGITYHVFEAVNPATALLDYARNNHVDHIVLAASGSSRLRRYLGSVSSQVVAEAPCTVTVVRATDRRS